MDKIKIHALRCGQVRTTKYLPFNPDNKPLMTVAGVGVPQKDWAWSPVYCYYIEHPKGKVLIDTAWSRRMSPDGVEDKKAEIKELGFMLYTLNQGYTPKGESVDEQLNSLGVKTSDLDYVVLTHLDCDHACGLHQVADAKRIIVSEDEMKYANKLTPKNIMRYKKRWWKDVPVTQFAFSGHEGPFSESFDLFSDGTIQLIHIPGHCAGLVCVKITGKNGKYVLLTSDGAYSHKNWKDLVLPGIHANRRKQLKSLEWIRNASMDSNCVESLSTHDPNVEPHVVELEI
ncbi:MAG: N-acyl homoserine lactonase family protein [Muribaculaceae bacterium]|nr:N-acyl homoserine lactonase family protein [Muribaculaceae bacterium]